MLKAKIKQQHCGASVLGRFIRMLRDMNKPTMKTKLQSHHPKAAFSERRIRKHLGTYNSTTHSTTSTTPEDMLKDEAGEARYITRCLNQREQQGGAKRTRSGMTSMHATCWKSIPEEAPLSRKP